MNRLYKLTILCIKEAFRIPIAIFFNVIFPIIMLVIFVTINGGNRELVTGYSVVDFSFGIALIMGMAATSCIYMPKGIAIDRDKGIIQTNIMFGVNPVISVFSRMLAVFIIGMGQFFIIFLVAYFTYDITIPSIPYLLAYISQYLLILLGMLNIGLLIGLASKKVEESEAIGMILMFLVLIFAGVMGSVEQFPKWIQDLSKYVTTTYIGSDLGQTWMENQYFSKELILVSFGYIVILGAFNVLVARKKLDSNIVFK